MLKNLTNFFTLGGDFFLYGRTYKLNVWGCVALMALSALCGAVTDLAFDARGYFWQMVNCLFTAGRQLRRALWRAAGWACLALFVSCTACPGARRAVQQAVQRASRLHGTWPHSSPLRSPSLLALGGSQPPAPRAAPLPAAYSLYMRGAMDKVAQHTSDGKKLGEFSMVRGWERAGRGGGEGGRGWAVQKARPHAPSTPPAVQRPPPPPLHRRSSTTTCSACPSSR